MGDDELMKQQKLLIIIIERLLISSSEWLLNTFAFNSRRTVVKARLRHRHRHKRHASHRLREEELGAISYQSHQAENCVRRARMIIDDDDRQAIVVIERREEIRLRRKEEQEVEVSCDNWIGLETYL